jgi:hypothetical protein
LSSFDEWLPHIVVYFIFNQYIAALPLTSLSTGLIEALLVGIQTGKQGEKKPKVPQGKT